MNTEADFEPGKVYNRRQDIHGKYGGQRQGGISTPAQFPVVLIFTGESGEEYGYHDEYRNGHFFYTGEGQTGDMKMLRGNRAIRDHVRDGKTLHLFKYVMPGLVRYIGEAEYQGHSEKQRPDKDGKNRQVIVFDLSVED